MRLHLPLPRRNTPPQPEAAQLVAWTAWHTAAMLLTLTDLGIATALFTLHYAVGTILALLGGVQAVALGMIGGLYQLTSKKAAQ